MLTSVARRPIDAVRHRLIVRVRELDLVYIPNISFSRVKSRQEARILADRPVGPPVKAVKPTPGLPPYLRALYDTPLLTREQEAHLFRKMNYLKYKTSRLRDDLDSHRPSVRAMHEILQLADQAMAVRNEIITANLRLVVNIARRYAHSSDELFDLISDGNISLMRAVDRFDYDRGFRFSTYATWALIKNYSRSIAVEIRQLARFRTGEENPLDNVESPLSDLPHRVDVMQARQHGIAKMLQHLDEREHFIIVSRFGLDRDAMTLTDVGKALGVGKERIRQLEARAMDKLMRAAVTERIDPFSMIQV